jgi:hypothetical protein
MYWFIPYVSLGVVLVEVIVGGAAWVGAFSENKI